MKLLPRFGGREGLKEPANLVMDVIAFEPKFRSLQRISFLQQRSMVPIPAAI